MFVLAGDEGAMTLAPVSLASPKSRIFSRPSFVTKRFSGFTSQWITPRSCAAARPCASSTV